MRELTKTILFNHIWELYILGSFIAFYLTKEIRPELFYFNGVILIFCSVIYIYFTPKFKGFKKHHEPLFRHILTVTATFTGVFLAITFNDFEKRKEDNVKIISLLNNTKTNVMVCRSIWAQFINEPEYKILPNDSTLSRSIVNGNTPPYPEQLFSLLENDFVLTYLSNPSLRILSQIRWQLPTIRNVLNTKVTANKIYLNSANYYYHELGLARETLGLEVRYQRKEISIEQLNDSLNALSKGVLDSIE